MFLSLHSSVTANRVTWPQLIDLASVTGFPGVDVNVSGALREGLAKTRLHLEAKRVRAGILYLPVEFRRDEEIFRKDLDALESAAHLAVGLDCRRMATWLLPSSENPADVHRALMKKRLGACAQILAKSQVRLGLEFVSPVHLRKRFPHEFIWRMNDMLEFARECGKNCGLLLDSWHWHHAGATPEDIIKAGRDAVVEVHFNDAASQDPEKVLDSERLMPGEGVINLIGFLKALQKVGYQDAVSVEVFGRGLKDMTPEAGAALALRTAKAVFAKAEIPI